MILQNKGYSISMGKYLNKNLKSKRHYVPIIITFIISREDRPEHKSGSGRFLSAEQL